MARDYRHVHFGTEKVAEHKQFCNNRVSTTLYVRGAITPFLFLFKGVILEEFSKLANFYFIIVVSLQLWPTTSNTGGFASTLPALVGVVTFASALKLKQVCSPPAALCAQHLLVSALLSSLPLTALLPTYPRPTSIPSSSLLHVSCFLAPSPAAPCLPRSLTYLAASPPSLPRPPR